MGLELAGSATKDNNEVKNDAIAEKTSRKQTSKMIGINLSVSRVRKHVDKNNVNADIEAACSELKSLRALEVAGETVDHSTLSKETVAIVNKAYMQIYNVRKNKHEALKTRSDNPTDGKNEMEEFPSKTESLTEKIEYVSKLRCRFSSDASVVLASALDYVVQELVKTAMMRAQSQGKAIIQVQHVVQGDFANLGVYSLVNKLDVVQKALRNENESVEEEGNEDDKKEDDKKEGNEDDKKEGNEDDKKEGNEDDEDDKKDSTFEFYIKLICKSVKAKLVEKDISFTSIRISKNISKFCSDVVIQLIERISPLIKLYTTTAKVKTVNDDVIMFIFKFLLLDAGSSSDDHCKFMQERMKVYREFKWLD
jgi:histone H3/H4